MIATQYEIIEKVKENLTVKGIDVQKHMSEGTLLIIDAAHGYFGHDVMGPTRWHTLRHSTHKGRKAEGGLTWFGCLDSFYAFDYISEMMDYELSFAPKWDAPLMKTICSHHAKNFGMMLSEKQKKAFV